MIVNVNERRRIGMFKKVIYLMSVVAVSLSLSMRASAVVTVVGGDTTTQSHWRTAADLEPDREYGTDGYVMYGLNAPDGAYKAPYDASSLFDNADPGASHDSAVSLPVYISDISLADNSGGMWSGNGNFGQIEDPNDPNLALTNTPVIANSPDPYVFTMTRSMAAALRLTVVCACGDGQVPEWTITVDDGSSAAIGTVMALDSPNIVYQMFKIPKGSTPITVSVAADNADGWITGFAFDSAISVVGSDTTTQSNWRTAADLEPDQEYGTDGYVMYGLNAPDGAYKAPYDASSLFESADPGASHDSAVSLPVYIGDISLADNSGGMWSGNGNFGQIEDPNDPNLALTNTPVIANGPDPYVFTLTRSMTAAFRLTIICACGDGQVPEWTITVDDGLGATTGTVTALDSPNIVYQTFKIPSGDTPITVSASADSVDGWITGLAFDSAITVVGSDTSTQSHWRTAAALEPDQEYGTDGYVIYGLNAADGVWNTPYDASTLVASTDPGASHDSAVSLPAYIEGISLADETGRWSGNGNFGQIEDPNDPDNALTNTPVIAWGPEPYVFTLTRSTAAALRLTVICATGDAQVPEWTITVDDGLGATTGTVTALDSPNVVYQVFEIPYGSAPITVSVDVTNEANAAGWITGFAFDEEVDAEPAEPEVSGKATLLVPEDGAWMDAAWTMLEWEPGPFAVSHDVYVGVDFDALSEATLDDVGIFVGNTTENLFLAGVPGGAIPDGLLPGTTYYWRVDEVNEAHPLSPWQGDVWSFSTTDIGSDTTTQSHWRTAATLEADHEYGTDGYVIYGLNADDGVYSAPYDASSLIVSNDPGASHDSAISLPAYIGEISLADNSGGMWSGNGNFGQIEDPNAPDSALTSTPVIANSPDPYVFTMTRSMAAALRLTVICATGDGQVPTWTITVDDGTSVQTRTIKALASPNIVYQMFEIPLGDTPITVSTEADVVNGWITGFAFDSD